MGLHIKMQSVLMQDSAKEQLVTVSVTKASLEARVSELPVLVAVPATVPAPPLEIYLSLKGQTMITL
jgi:hypothetical protein